MCISDGVMHPELAYLRARAKELDHDAACMYNGTGAITGMGFFPCAWGGVESETAIRGRPIMVLGQDQDNRNGLERSVRKGNEVYSPSWRNLLALLAKAGIGPEGWFFTNLIMGVRESKRNTSPSPALANPAFNRGCA